MMTVSNAWLHLVCNIECSPSRSISTRSTLLISNSSRLVEHIASASASMSKPTQPLKGQYDVITMLCIVKPILKVESGDNRIWIWPKLYYCHTRICWANTSYCYGIFWLLPPTILTDAFYFVSVQQKWKLDVLLWNKIITNTLWGAIQIKKIYVISVKKATEPFHTLAWLLRH